MSVRSLENQFARIGARVKVREGAGRGRGGRGFTVDVQRDREGEFFLLEGRGEEQRVEVVDREPAERHLLLMVEAEGFKQKFLCGHDERHWFVAAVPERARATSVTEAMEALKPAEVRAAQTRRGLRVKQLRRRRNAAFVRQGEWFFVPAPALQVAESMVLRNEPLSRGAGSKPHVVEFCYRTGGDTRYVCPRRPSGLTQREYERFLHEMPEARTWNWRVMRRNPELYVRGRVRHADHATIVLPGWHRVLMNTENQAMAMRHVSFMD